MTHRLYIETVGCQMNMLDSELVVAALRKQGYELVDTPKKADTILFNTCSVRQHAEDKIYSALGRLKHAKTTQPGQDHRRARLHGAEGPGADLRSGRRTSIWSSARASLHQVPELIDEIAAGSGPQMAVSLDRKDGHAARNRAELRELRPAARPRDAADAVSGLRADHDRLRQVLHLLHRAERARARSRAGRRSTSSPKCDSSPTKAAARSRCSARRSTATSISTATAARRGCRDLLAMLHDIDGHRAAQVRHELPEGHDRRPAAGGARPAEGVAVPARAGAERLERSAAADEAAVHGRGVPRDDGPHPRDGARVLR